MLLPCCSLGNAELFLAEFQLCSPLKEFSMKMSDHIRLMSWLCLMLPHYPVLLREQCLYQFLEWVLFSTQNQERFEVK